MCILFVWALLKLVSYYDLSVLSMSVMGFKNKNVGGVSYIQVYFRICVLFKSLFSFFYKHRCIAKGSFTIINIYESVQRLR